MFVEIPIHKPATTSEKSHVFFGKFYKHSTSPKSSDFGKNLDFLQTLDFGEIFKLNPLDIYPIHFQ